MMARTDATVPNTAATERLMSGLAIVAPPALLLPVDAVSIALLYIDVDDVPCVARTCKDWTTKLARVDDELWGSLLQKHSRVLSCFSDKISAVIGNNNDDEPLAPSSQWKNLFRRAFLLMRMTDLNLSLDVLDRGGTIEDPRGKSSYNFDINVPPLSRINQSGSQIDSNGTLRLEMNEIDAFPVGQSMSRVSVVLRSGREERAVVFSGSFKNLHDVQFMSYRWNDEDAPVEVDGRKVRITTNATLTKKANARVGLDLQFDLEFEGERYDNLSEYELLRLLKLVSSGQTRRYTAMNGNTYTLDEPDDPTGGFRPNGKKKQPFLALSQQQTIDRIDRWF